MDVICDLVCGGVVHRPSAVFRDRLGLGGRTTFDALEGGRSDEDTKTRSAARESSRGEKELFRWRVIELTQRSVTQQKATTRRRIHSTRASARAPLVSQFLIMTKMHDVVTHNRVGCHGPFQCKDCDTQRDKKEFSQRQLQLPQKQTMSCRHCNEAEKEEAKALRRDSLDESKELKTGEVHNAKRQVHNNFKSISRVA